MGLHKEVRDVCYELAAFIIQRGEKALKSGLPHLPGSFKSAKTKSLAILNRVHHACMAKD